MSKSNFPKPDALLDAEFETFKHILESIASLEKRIQACEIKIKSMKSE